MANKKKYGRRVIAAALAASLVIGTTTYHLAGEADAKLHSVESSQYGDGVLYTNKRMGRGHCKKCDIEIEREVNTGNHYKTCVGRLDSGYGVSYKYADYSVEFRSTVYETDIWERELTKAQYDELSKLDVITVADVDALLGDPDTYDVRYDAVEATETTNGSYEIVTYETVNGTEVGRTAVEIPAHAHTWDSGVVTRTAECYIQGRKVYTCTTCGYKEYENLPADPNTHLSTHSVRENEVPATATENGSYDLVTYCYNCGTEVSRKTVVDPFHNWVWSATIVEPGCTTEGEDAYTCTICRKIKTETVPATGHTAGEAVKENVDDATCTEGGSYEAVTYCTSCGEELSRETVSVLATGHTAGEAVKEKKIPATCTEAGSYEAVTYCTADGVEMSREPIAVPATGHAWNDGKITTAPTCTEAGAMTYTCTTCGETKAEAIDATGHTAGEAVKEKVVASTCTEAGSYESVVYCTSCGEELSWETIAVPATGHAWNDGKITTAPTCTEAGVMTYTCTTCDKTKKKAIKATGHTWNDGKVTKEPSMSATGVKTYTCTTCGATKQKTLAKVKLSTPKVTAVTNVNGGVKVTWNAVSGAARYRVYHKTANGKWVKLGSTTGTSFTDTKVSGGTTYSYTVRCVTADDQGSTSNYDSKGLSIKYIAAPKLSSVTNSATGVTIKWSASKGAEKYRVYRKTGSGKWTKLADTTSTSYTDTTAKAGTTYSYRVKAVASDGTSTSANSGSKSIKYIAAPKLSSAANAAAGVTIKWSASKGAVKYRVFRKTGSGSWTKLADTTSTSYTDKTAKAGTTYTYTVRCITADGKSYASGYDSAGKTIKRLTQPTPTVSKTSSGIKTSWSKVTGASKYYVYRKTASGSWSKIATTTSTSYTDKTAKKGTTYYYTVRAVSGSYLSSYTSSKAVKR